MLPLRNLLRPLLALAVAAATLVGCQRWNWQGNGYDDQVNALTKDLRPPADERRFTGVDAQAHDIERSLGVR